MAEDYARGQADELSLPELRQIFHRGAETHRIFARGEAVVVGIERAIREAKTLAARIAGLQSDLAAAEVQVAAKETELENLGQQAVALRAESERAQAERIAQLSLEYGERETREKALFAERLAAMERSYDEAHAARRTDTERLIAEGDRTVAAAFEHRDLTVHELEREEQEARDRLDGVRVEIGVAEGQLARLRASLRELLGSAQAAVPPDPA